MPCLIVKKKERWHIQKYASTIGYYILCHSIVQADHMWLSFGEAVDTLVKYEHEAQMPNSLLDV